MTPDPKPEIIEPRNTSFTQSTNTEKILGAMAKVMADVERINKDATNTHDSYEYASEKAIKEALHKAFLSNKIVFMLNVVDRQIELIKSPKGDKPLIFLTLEYRFMESTSGQFVGGKFMSSGHSRDDKGFYAAVTGAIKYILTSNFLIPTGDDPEDDKEDTKEATEKPKKTDRPSKPAQTGGPKGKTITEDQRKLMFVEIGELYKLLMEFDPVQFPKDNTRADEVRKVVLVNSIGVESSKEVDMDKLDKLLKTLEKFKNAGPEKVAALLFTSKSPLSKLEVAKESATPSKQVEEMEWDQI